MFARSEKNNNLFIIIQANIQQQTFRVIPWVNIDNVRGKLYGYKWYATAHSFEIAMNKTNYILQIDQSVASAHREVEWLTTGDINESNDPMTSFKWDPFVN